MDSILKFIRGEQLPEATPPASFPSSSMELMAASKIIGRECATLNKQFIQCKVDRGEHPALCLEEGKRASKCGAEMYSRLISHYFLLTLFYRVKDLNASFPVEYKQFQSCLDLNDYRFQDCRSEEAAFLSSWNNRLAQASNKTA